MLAKSIPAKRYGIQTGESLFMARSKYPNLIVAAPDFDWYVKNSKAITVSYTHLDVYKRQE